MAKGARTAVRIRTVKRDRLDPTPAGPGERIWLSGLIVLPRQFYEEGKGWVTIEGHDVYVLDSSRVRETADGDPRAYERGDVRASDEFEVDGVVWQVDGPPADYEKGIVRKATLIRLKRTGAS